MGALYEFEHLLAPAGWLAPGWLEVDDDGNVAGLHDEAPRTGRAERVAGHAVPGMPNLHSHAFQRAMAGLAERAGSGEDSFWTWREVMYRFVGALAPDDVEAIAAQLYVEMLKAGYTAVGEFHYLHHAPDGTAYADRAEMSGRIAAAAARTGIGLTLLPVLYGAGDFGAAPAAAGQRRFLNDVDKALDIVATMEARLAGDAQARIGIAPHSLRAVPPDALSRALDGLDRIDATAPIHIHIAEQTGEVDDCLAWCGRRPVEWLLDNAAVGQRWCLVHATHMSAAETEALARSGAVAGLCPTTEANLGDGLFRLRPYLDGGGRIGVGSDSHVSVSPVEELRWLEYGQRLAARRRAVAAPAGGATGASLYAQALQGGAQALGRKIGALAPGNRADLAVLDGDHPTLAGRSGEAILDAYIFSGNANPVRDVMVGGRWTVRDGHHADEDTIAAAYRTTLKRLI